jgi:hypothetical protein
MALDASGHNLEIDGDSVKSGGTCSCDVVDIAVMLGDHGGNLYLGSRAR